MRRSARLCAVVTTSAASLLLLPGGTAAAAPTCSTTLGVAVPGQHVVGDYVTGTGRASLDWPPAGGVGDSTGGEGAAVPGGPAAGGHFASGVAPGASFCLAQSQSPGKHPGLG